MLLLTNYLPLRKQSVAEWLGVLPVLLYYGVLLYCLDTFNVVVVVYINELVVITA